YKTKKTDVPVKNSSSSFSVNLPVPPPLTGSLPQSAFSPTANASRRLPVQMVVRDVKVESDAAGAPYVPQSFSNAGYLPPFSSHSFPMPGYAPPSLPNNVPYAQWQPYFQNDRFGPFLDPQSAQIKPDPF
ncbi:hypothetical protein PENTCL1PPCAC_1165, partial [Pristionchus entomophagus]